MAPYGVTPNSLCADSARSRSTKLGAQRRIVLLSVLFTTYSCAIEECPRGTTEIDGYCIKDEEGSSEDRNAAIASQVPSDQGGRDAGRGCAGEECDGKDCEGSDTRECGNCGTQSRTCRGGDWSDWSECTAMGECQPDRSRSCGMEGMQLCGADCSYGPCGNQICQGTSTQECGNCGVQSRTCDVSTGQWSEWSQCSAEGACRPAESRACGMGGSQSCGSDCQWPVACSGQQCSGPLVQPCGRCGQQARTCNTNTGMPSAWSAECQGQGACMPGAFQGCGPNRVQRCTAQCTWGLCDTCTPGFTDCSGACVQLASDPQHCGSCNAAPCASGQTCVASQCFSP
jgi:hypothetical protein